MHTRWYSGVVADGRKLVFATRGERGSGVYVVNADGADCAS